MNRYHIIQHPIDGIPCQLMPGEFITEAEANQDILRLVAEELNSNGFCSGYGTFVGIRETAEMVVRDMNR